MPRSRLLRASLATALTVLGCSEFKRDTLHPTAPERAAAAAQPLDALFASAGAEFGVPGDLLKAVGYVETRWQMIVGHEEFEGMPPAFGIMALRGDRLRHGARLANESPEAVRTDAHANIRAAAALLRAYADELRIADRAALGAWAPAVARYSGIANPDAQAVYVNRDVYEVLRTGATRLTRSKGVVATLAPRPVTTQFRGSVSAAPASPGPDYPSAIWRPSPNYNDRPADSTGKIHMVIIHSCEGSYTGCWSWLTNPNTRVSAHYVVNEAGTEISQLVREGDRGWHIGARYDCVYNAEHDCWLNTTQSNHFTVGIEHGGYAEQTEWPAPQIDVSAQLACDVTRRNGIPRDKFHLVAHGQLQPWNRWDPGPNWPWTDYINLIEAYCQDAVVDNDNSHNDSVRGYVELSANWTTSTATSGYYGTNFAQASVADTADAATFWFLLPAAASLSVEAWWTSGSDRSSAAPYIAFTAAGEKLGTVYADQRQNGGQWNRLATFAFTAGWNRVALSRWAVNGQVVIADAIRLQ